MSVQRRWLEGTIIGVCVAIVAVLLQRSLETAGASMRLLALVAAAALLCGLQFLVSRFGRPRS